MNRVRARAWIGTIVFLFLAPGIVAGLIPWAITGWRVPDWGGWLVPVATVAGLLILGGIAVLLDAFVRFARADGTPAPPVPTAHPVITGPYRFVRNPMYVAVAAIVVGQAMLFGSWATLVYLAVAVAAVALFVRFYEEPTLLAAYDGEYVDYKNHVRAWLPRATPWQGASPLGGGDDTTGP